MNFLKTLFIHFRTSNCPASAPLPLHPRPLANRLKPLCADIFEDIHVTAV